MSIEKYNKKSSNISEEGVAYDTEKQQLFVSFKGFGKTPKISRYRYDGVPHTVWEDLKKADSLGGFVNREIVKGGYRYERL